jgi:transcriptional regulator with XRE-family HTH domain
VAALHGHCVGVPTANVSLTYAFGLVVRQMRTSLGWTQEELAYRASVHRTYIGDLENGRKSPTLDVVEALAAALGKDAHRLIAEAERNLRALTGAGRKEGEP